MLTSLAFGLKLLGFWRAIKRAIAALFGAIAGFVARYPWQAALIVALIFGAWCWRGWSAADERVAAEQLRTIEARADGLKWRKAHLSMIERVKSARAEARELDRQNADRVRNEYRTAFERIANETDDLRERYGALLAQRLHDGERSAEGGAAHPADRGGAATMPGLPTLSGSALRPAESAIVSRSDLFICSANLAQLEGLIAAWDKVASIDVNGNDRPRPDAQAR